VVRGARRSHPSEARRLHSVLSMPKKWASSPASP
jgi:hypothetical protein